MMELLSARIVWGEDDVARNNSFDESDDEQLPNFPTEIVISSEDLECNVCFLPYSDRRVPLVLTKCGHSLCKKCCKASQQQFLFSRFINCPFCRTRTPGSFEMLPKNYTVMRIVQKIGEVE
ncbi:hypothetical protein CAEBREN_05351 [Caenorhabditis brenneri]|uniref:RING-type domain-containing protein n=1 Tax=Caenorhabditis brenneri TaxID=135651 RepID=G0M9Y7_CAEBE|nr:hypothetical protein CAEBREN_05351 [Caenorhabditis brenneri]